MKKKDPAASSTDKVIAKHRIDRAGRVDLERFDPSEKPLSSGDKQQDKARVAELSAQLALVQDRYYALKKNKVLLLLQGMDTSGKDGTIRAVFQAVDPLGVRAVGYRAPTDPEKDRDFLWRHHRDVPGRGEIVIFNRSHYEAVLIEYVHRWIDEAERDRRLAHIVAWERMLTETGTTLIKCFLHISKDEQRLRLQERIDDPDKHWKFNLGDLEERKLWSKYQHAYEDLLARTGTEAAPWYIVPADSKTHRNLMVTTLLLQALEKLAPRYPPANAELMGLRVR
jgi:PPK2 family polyphosphate:nucleotide phosphotransferase